MSARELPGAGEVLRRMAAQAGLMERPAPFPREGTLAARLAQAAFLMAPMAGVSDAAWRIMARAGGAGLAYSEMVSVAGIHFAGARTWELAEPDDAEPDLAVQLFGSDPAQFREACHKLRCRLGGRLALVDVNMACPVPKVTRKGEGAALMEDPCRAAAIVRACREELDVPVTVKLRRGTRPPIELAPEFARAMEQAGAEAVAVHGRFASQRYAGEADWGCVRRVVEAVGVPVIGSGDVRDAGEAARRLATSGATAVMVARGSYGAPWVFGDARAAARGESPRPHDARQRLAALRCHLVLLAATGAHLAKGRSLVGWYAKGLPHAAELRRRSLLCETLDDYLALVDGAEGLLGEARA